MRKQQQEIQWFLNLVNVEEIGELSKEKRAEIADQIFKYTRFQRIGESQENKTPGSKFFELLPGSIDSARLAFFQKRIEDFFEYMMSCIDHVKKIPTDKWTISGKTDFYPSLNADGVKIKPNFKIDGFSFELNVKNGEKSENNLLKAFVYIEPGSDPIEITTRRGVRGLKYESRAINGGKFEYRLKPESLKDAFIDTSHYDQSGMAEGFFLLSFMNLINGVPIEAFKKCPECGNWFINLTKKKKEYCANRCAARNRQREKRFDLKKRIAAGDSTAIREDEINSQKSRSRARRSYVRRVKNRTPKARPHERPRKPHWEEGVCPE